MPTTTNKKIILTGSPFAWIHLIGGSPLTISEKWRFDNLQSSNYKIFKPESTSAKGDNIDINRADGAIWRFPKINLILSGIDETDITPADTSSDATGKGEITIVTNEAPIEANSWTAFINDLKANLDKMFMITIGTGYSHFAYNDTSLRKPEGYVYMIGKISNDIEQELNNNPTSLTMTFVSYKNSGLQTTDLTTLAFTGIPWKLGGSNPPSITPKAIDVNGATSLLNGDILVAADILYS